MSVCYYAKLIYGVPFSEAIKEETLEEEIEVTCKNTKTGQSTGHIEYRKTPVIWVGDLQFTRNEFNDACWEKGGILQDENGNSYVHRKYYGTDDLKYGVFGVIVSRNGEYREDVGKVDREHLKKCFLEAKKLLESVGLGDRLSLHLLLTVSG